MYIIFFVQGNAIVQRVIIGGYIIMPRSSFKARPKSRKYRRTKRGNRRKKNKRKNNATKRRRKQYGGKRPPNKVYLIAREYIMHNGIEHDMFLEELNKIDLPSIGIHTREYYINYVAEGRLTLTDWRNLPDTNLDNNQIDKYNEAIRSLVGIEGI
jgi:hypothetical protein